MVGPVVAEYGWTRCGPVAFAFHRSHGHVDYCNLVTHAAHQNVDYCNLVAHAAHQSFPKEGAPKLLQGGCTKAFPRRVRMFRINNSCVLFTVHLSPTGAVLFTVDAIALTQL
jgi:hypothetical protein